MMCTVFIAFKNHPTYPLIVASNRDEFYERPTKQAHFWEDKPDIFAGRDMEQRGTWLGVSKMGRFAVITNFRNPGESRIGKKSRGQIVNHFLTGDERPEQFLQALQNNRHNYPGFNLLVSDLESLYYYSNVENEIKRLEEGLYGLSNHLLDTPWPKVVNGKKELSRLIDENQLTAEALLTLLANNQVAPDAQLPETGVPIEMERELSALFIDTGDYGTRCSTAIFIDNEGKVSFTERTYPAGDDVQQQFFLKKKKASDDQT